MDDRAGGKWRGVHEGGDGEMGEFAQTQVGDGDEVGGGSEAAGGALGLLEQAVHGFDEGVGAMVEHAAHDAVEVLLVATGRQGQVLPFGNPTKARNSQAGLSRLRGFKPAPGRRPALGPPSAW